MRPKRVAAVHDMSGFGRCSLTVVLPILSSMGIQCCPLPTAFLSAHTGFEGFTFLDMTDEIQPAADHWKSLGLQFEAIYSGFLGSERQISIVDKFISEFKSKDTIILVDPVMGDNGRKYRTYTDTMCEKMSELTMGADIITPNITEACFLLGKSYDEAPGSKAGVSDWLYKLSNSGKRSVVITGVSFEDGRLGAACFDSGNGVISFAFSDRIETQYHGTGDIFASVLLGAKLNGKSLEEASQTAVCFVYDCVKLSHSEGQNPDEGVSFEPMLKNL